MKTIAYYVSDYGYGHASRSIAIIRELLTNKEIKIIVCHSFALEFIKQSLNTDRVCYRNIRTDIGYILENDSIYPDKGRLLGEYNKFVADWDEKIVQEYQFLKENKVDLVLSDISPLPFEAAANLNIPSIGVSNFTWYTAYQGLIDEIHMETFKNSYKSMTKFFSLAGGSENWDIPTKKYGFFSRKVDPKEVQQIRKLVNPKGDLKVVFLGLGMKIDVGSLEELPIWDSPNCSFIVSSNVQVNKPNIFKIPSTYLESQNFIAASDLVISKAGWGMIGEALSANVSILILERPSMKEDNNSIEYLKQHGLCHTIKWEDFKNYQISTSSIKNNHSSLIDYGCMNYAKRIVEDLTRILTNNN